MQPTCFNTKGYFTSDEPYNEDYLKAKHDVYAAHHALCSAACRHGDYYWLQASYYIQFGPESTPEYTNLGRTGLLSATFRQ